VSGHSPPCLPSRPPARTQTLYGEYKGFEFARVGEKDTHTFISYMYIYIYIYHIQQQQELPQQSLTNLSSITFRSISSNETSLCRGSHGKSASSDF
jgi:hypothetical protein